MDKLQREEPSHFGAGPAQLPTAVLQQAALDLVNFANTGIGIGEISHRSREATKIIEDAKSRFKELLHVPDTHEVFFMQGGGTTGFSSVATNMMAAYAGKKGKVGKGGYLVTGSWSQKAYQEAVRLGVPAEVIFDSRDYDKNGKFGSIPDEAEWCERIQNRDDLAYVYLCENETVHGVEWPQLPRCLVERNDVEIVADLSSDILSREIDVSQYGIILAGAQKNIGLAGLTLYVIKKSILDDITKLKPKDLISMGIPVTPIAFDYPTVVKNNSAYNTIPIFTLYVIDLVFQRLISRGGIKAQQAENERKAKLLYDTLDSHSDFFDLPVDPKYRSKMNGVFTIKKSGLDELFLNEATKRKLTGLKGHRSVGGFRASIYNAVTLQSVQKLVDFINEFVAENS